MNDNPAFGAGLQPFMGIPSFMRLPSWVYHLIAGHPTAAGRDLVRAKFGKHR
jgi:hypothetical protein